MHSMPSFSLNDSFVEIQLRFIAKINILFNSTGDPDVMYRIFGDYAVGDCVTIYTRVLRKLL